MELGCPVPGLGGADSLTDPNNRTAVLHYLVHELMSVRLAATTVTKTKQVQTHITHFPKIMKYPPILSQLTDTNS